MLANTITLDKHHLILVAAVGLLALAGAALAVSYLDMQRAAAQLQQQLKDDRSQIASIVADAQARMAALAAQKQQIVTVPQIVKALPQAFGPMPQPITVTPPAAPTEPLVVNVPQPDAKPLFDELVTAQQDKIALATCQQQLTVTERDRDAAVKAAKGGSFWHKAAGTAKAVAIGIGIGVALGAKL